MRKVKIGLHLPKLWSKVNCIVFWTHSVENIGSRINRRITSAVLDTPVTLTFDLLTSGSVHAEVLPWAICLVSTDFGFDGLSRFPFRARTNRQTNRQTRLNALPHAGGYTAGVGKKSLKLVIQPAVNRTYAHQSRHPSPTLATSIAILILSLASEYNSFSLQIKAYSLRSQQRHKCKHTFRPSLNPSQPRNPRSSLNTAMPCSTYRPMTQTVTSEFCKHC